jgi:hypothetical protein
MQTGIRFVVPEGLEDSVPKGLQDSARGFNPRWRLIKMRRPKGAVEPVRRVCRG